jgi:uncharacterized repeat protein (TIGR03803 family)
MRLQDTTACRLLLAASLLIVARPAESQTFGTLKEYGEGHQASRAPLLQGADGAFYGTMSKGGAFGLGGVFRLSADGSTFTTIYSFDGAHGAVPVGGLVQGPDALYGTTTQGGVAGHGTVFKVSADGSAFSILHAFDGSNGSSPWAGLTLGTDGALYGTTFDGGVYGAGTVFRLARDGSMFSLLHSFQRTDGAHLIAGLIQGADGALYGTTGEGGAQTTSFGTIFRILTDGSEFAVLRNMDAASGGTGAGLVQLGDGLLYGVSGGGAAGYGAVFRIAPDGSAFSVLTLSIRARAGRTPMPH